MKRKYSKIIKKIAREKGISPELVYKEMQWAIEDGYNNTDPEVQARWHQLFPDGKMPSPEKLIEILANKIEKEI
jgi:hypothetical protein